MQGGSTIFVAAVGMCVLGSLLWFFVAREHAGRTHTMFRALVAAWLIEAVIAGRGANVPEGLLRPVIAGQDFRLPDVVILTALLARALARSQPIQLRALTVAWVAFGAWYAANAIPGLTSGNDFAQTLFQAKAVWYILGSMAIAASADIALIRADIRRLVIPGVIAIGIGLVVSTSTGPISISLPGQRLPSVGVLSNDTITVLTCLGAFAVLLEMTAQRTSWWRSLLAAALLLAPVAGAQRAAFAGAAVSVALLAVFVLLTRPARRHLRVTRTEIAFSTLATVAVGFAAWTAGIGTRTVEKKINRTFLGDGEEASAEARVSLYEAARMEIVERPWLGHGLGKTVLLRNENTLELRDAAAHNLVLDTLIRVGIVGLTLLIVALALTLIRSWQVWSRTADSTCAAIAGGAFIATANLVSKAMVEPAIDKFRLAICLGIVVGLVVRMQREFDRERMAQADVTSADADIGTNSAGRYDPWTVRYSS
jgi:O-antigen ligase